MTPEVWFWVWLALAALLYVGEMLTTTLFLLPFAIGASVALFANLLGAEVWLQWVLFIVVSAVALAALRPVAKRLTAHGGGQKSGVDRLIGETGVITQENTPAGENRARVGRDIWNVATESGSKLPVGTAVKVLRVDGTHLIVEKSPAVAAGSTVEEVQ